MIIQYDLAKRPRTKHPGPCSRSCSTPPVRYDNDNGDGDGNGDGDCDGCNHGSGDNV